MKIKRAQEWPVYKEGPKNKTLQVGCGKVSRMVASHTSGPGFESNRCHFNRS